MIPTYEQQAQDFNLWQEYFDTHATMSEAEFDAMSVEDKISLLRDAFGPETGE